ncbi:MAG TPA: hypothetical protein VLD39_06710 [Gammaproteobacteria bacterium]|nr:hypothetical protein [Gammaproteobacteria bacterium]
MLRVILPSLVIVLAWGCNGEAPALPATGGDAASAARADRDWVAALERGDVDAAAALADEFQWIDTRGRSRDRAQTVGDMTALGDALSGESGAQRYSYGHVDVVTSERPDERLMRVWIREPGGWRVFVVIGTALVSGATPFAATGSAAGRDCVNPCRSMPYTPTTENERIIAGLFMQLKMDEWRPNPERWAPYVLDGVYYTTATAQLSKEARVEHLTGLAARGEPSFPGDPVVSMRIVDLDDSAVMVARHDPYRGGQPYLSVRVWAFRDGRWQLANTQQTAIADAPPVAPF